MNFLFGCFIGMIASFVLFSVLSAGATEDSYSAGFVAGYKQAVDEFEEATHKL